MRRATVNTDASFCPDTKAGGWATWIALDGGSKIKRSGRFKQRPANSGEAELLALLNGAWLAAQHGGTLLLMQSDCKWALHKLENKRHKEVRALHRKCPGLLMKTKWVKAHTHKRDARHWVNDWCDRNAKAQMLKQRLETPMRIAR